MHARKSKEDTERKDRYDRERERERKDVKDKKKPRKNKEYATRIDGRIVPYVI